MTIESYLHKYAKVVVCSWLRKKIKLKDKYKRLTNIDIQTINEKYPMYNVYEEYPVCTYTKNDGTSNIIGIDMSWNDWTIQNNIKFISKHGIPTLYELKEHSKTLKILYIFDIGIVSDDKLKYIFEICNTSPCCDDKIKFIKQHSLQGYELNAQKIMDMVKPPFILEYLNHWM